MRRRAQEARAVRKREADAALQLPQKQKSKPRQPGAAPPEHPSLESPEGERPGKKAKSCAKPAAIGAASSSGSQEVVQTASAPEPLLRPNFERHSNKKQLIKAGLHPPTDRNVIRFGHYLFDILEARVGSWIDEVGLDRGLCRTPRPPHSFGVDIHAYNKATPPFNR